MSDIKNNDGKKKNGFDDQDFATQMTIASLWTAAPAVVLAVIILVGIIIGGIIHLFS